MKNTAFILIAFLLTANSFFPQSTQESPELKEASELAASVVKLCDQKKFDEAFPLAKRALQIREKILPETDPRVATLLLYLGDLYILRGDFRAAEQTFERLRRIFEGQFGPTSLKLAVVLDRLAMLYNRKHEVGKAEETYQRALAVREKQYGPDDVKISKALFSLAQFYRNQKKFDKALLSYRRALSIVGRVEGVDSTEFEYVSNGFICLAYESENKALIEELNDIRSRFSPALPPAGTSEILNGKALYLGRPSYPDLARAMRLSGKVTVSVVIDETGKVISASDMCQGPPYLTDAAVQAALKSRFSPTIVSGTPVQVKGVIQYRFVAY